MNKNECKRYLKRAYNSLMAHNRNLTVENIETEMKIVIEEQMSEYIAYSKIAVRNMLMSGNIEITLKDILGQIDVLPKIYTRNNAIVRSRKI